MVLLGTAVFAHGTVAAPAPAVRAYLCFPLLIWTTLRFGMPGATAGVLALSALAIGGTAAGRGPFAHAPLTASLVELELFLAVVPVTLLLLGASVQERRRLDDEIARHRLHLEARVAQRTWQLEAANRELEAFSYAVSHDLRAPLRAIEGFGALLDETLGTAVDAAGREYVRRMREGAVRMTGLVDALLERSRVTRAPLQTASIDLSALARGILRDLAAAEPTRRVDGVVADGVVATGDPALLGCVLTNLLGNAWKFTAGRPRARIELAVEPAGGDGPVYVVRGDRAGVGVAGAQPPLPALPAAPPRRGVPRHGHRAGDRAAHRPPPRRPDLGRGRARPGRHVPLHAGARHRRARPTPTGMSRGLVLLVEDDPADAALTQAALARAAPGLRVLLAPDGEAAMAHCLAVAGAGGGPVGTLPVLVLLDLQLPGMLGFDVLRRLRGEPRLQRLPVVVLSSSGLGADRREALAAGADAYVQKPAEFSALVSSLAAILARWVQA